MKRPRRFLKCELLDAAEAAAEYGLEAILTANGDIRFTQPGSRSTIANSADEALSGWLSNEGKAGGR